MRTHVAIIGALLLVSCSPRTPQASDTASGTVRVGEGNSSTRRETFQTAIPQGKPSLPGHGQEVGMVYGPISGVAETIANGVATVHYLEDGLSVIGVQANIAVPPDGWFYEAWLSNDDGSKMLSIGHLTNPFNDPRHSVRFETMENIAGMQILRITLEADDGNPAASAAVAQGILKPTSR